MAGATVGEIRATLPAVLETVFSVDAGSLACDKELQSKLAKRKACPGRDPAQPN